MQERSSKMHIKGTGKALYAKLAPAWSANWHWSITQVVNHYILSGQMLHATGSVMISWRLNIKHCTDHQKMQSAISLWLYKQTGNAVAKKHFKGTVKAPYAESTPARYRYFTMLRVTTQIVNHFILSGQTPQDAVVGQFDTVYTEMVTIASSYKVRNMATCSKCVIIKNLITCIILFYSDQFHQLGKLSAFSSGCAIMWTSPRMYVHFGKTSCRGNVQ